MEFFKSLIISIWKFQSGEPGPAAAGLDLEMATNMTIQNEQPVKKIEDYRAGYPRFSALIAANADFFICRRFLRLRARLLLLKQDKLSLLEQRLDQLDQDETSPLFLGKNRCDRNTARSSLLSEVEACLADYDTFSERTQRILSYNHAPSREVSSLQNWVDGTSSLSRDETAYLEHKKDLTSLTSSGDSAIKELENWVEDLFVNYYQGFRAIPLHDMSNDTNVYLYSGTLIRRTARIVMLLLITFLLLTPVVVCIAINSIWARICVIIASTVFYLAALSQLTNSRMIKLILVGATFATILTVFVSDVNGGSS